MRIVSRFAVLAAGALLMTGATAEAQTSGSINATATVLSAITITGTDLAFGNVAPTQTKTVSAASGGQFVVSAAAGAPVLASFTLPTTLGANVSIGTWTGLTSTANNAGSATPFTPSGTPQAFTIGGSSGTGNRYFWLGATLTTSGAAPGSYSAPVTLTVVYN